MRHAQETTCREVDLRASYPEDGKNKTDLNRASRPLRRQDQRMYTCIKGASPRRVAARLGSAHARNFRGCITYIMSILRSRNTGESRLYMRQRCQGVHSHKSCWNKENNHCNQVQKNAATNCVIRHTMTNNNISKQQPSNTFCLYVISTTAGAAAAAVRQQQAAPRV